MLNTRHPWKKTWHFNFALVCSSKYSCTFMSICNVCGLFGTKSIGTPVDRSRYGLLCSTQCYFPHSRVLTFHLSSCCWMKIFYCRGIRPLLIVKQSFHSVMDNPLSLSRSQSFNSFLPHFLPRLMLPRIFFIEAVRNSLDTSSLSLLLSSRLNFQIKTCLSVSNEPT